MALPSGREPVNVLVIGAGLPNAATACGQATSAAFIS
jgi:hypothetical protein